jgi:thymidine kinase
MEKKCVILSKNDGCRCKIWTKNELPSSEELRDFDVVGVDDADEFEGIEDWADEAASIGKEVILSCLARGQNKERFQRTKAIFSRSESVKFLDESDAF